MDRQPETRYRGRRCARLQSHTADEWRLRAAALGIVELDVPVQIVAPALGRLSETDRDADGGSGLRALGKFSQVHAGFDRRPAALAAVARDAAGNDVLPV